MSDLVIDSSVAAKWILPEPDSARAQQLVVDASASGSRLVVLDLAFPEVANAIWKRYRQKIITADEARQLLDALLRAPVSVESAWGLLPAALKIAVKYDRSVYDALFVALSRELKTAGVTADEPLYNVVKADFPEIKLLRDLQREPQIRPGEKEPE